MPAAAPIYNDDLDALLDELDGPVTLANDNARDIASLDALIDDEPAYCETLADLDRFLALSNAEQSAELLARPPEPVYVDTREPWDRDGSNLSPALRKGSTRRACGMTPNLQPPKLQNMRQNLHPEIRRERRERMMLRRIRRELV